MNTSEIINNACAHLGIAKADLAKQMGLYPSSFYRKLSNESMTFEELQKCLEIMGVTVELDIKYPDGKVTNSRANYSQLMERMTLLEKELETADNVARFHKKTIKEIRTELNSAVGYVELGLRHSINANEYLKKIEMVHTNMERVIAYSLGETFDTEIQEASEKQIQALAGQRVLLVEDNELNREMLKEVLIDYGLLVEEADNGNKAISLVTQNVPGYFQFILMDIEMPEQDGYETTIKLRNQANRIRANIPVIALTANANVENRERAKVVGMDDFLVKPVNPSRLLASLAKLL